MPKHSKNSQKSKWALITGATAGIGLATAESLAKAGWSLIITGRREDRLKKIKASLEKKYKIEVIAQKLDVQNIKSVESLFNKHDKLISRVELLVNNAGLARGREPFQDSNTSDFDEMIDTNIKGLLYVTRLMLPHMIKKNSGHIINLGSVAGRWVYPMGSVYCSTKFAVRAISEGIRMDLFGKNIRLTNIEPGVVETEFSEVRFRDKEKAKLAYAGFTPLTAADVAETILWCAERPAHVNIQELVLFPTEQASITQVSRR